MHSCSSYGSSITKKKNICYQRKLKKKDSRHVEIQFLAREIFLALVNRKIERFDVLLKKIAVCSSLNDN